MKKAFDAKDQLLVVTKTITGFRIKKNTIREWL
jgi:hypothetical protein